MATEKENKEYKTALDKIVDLEDKLKTYVEGSDKADKATDQLGDALKRLGLLESRFAGKKEEKDAEEDEDEDEDICLTCGLHVEPVGDGIYYCNHCHEYFEDEEE